MHKKAAQAAFERMTALDGIMSDYRDTSELMHLCKKAAVRLRVSDDLFFVLSHGQEVSRRSHGAFDVTVGPVVRSLAAGTAQPDSYPIPRSSPGPRPGGP